MWKYVHTYIWERLHVKWTCCCNWMDWWRMFCLLGAVTVFWSEFFRPLFFLRVDCEWNQPSFLAIVFNGAIAFNGDLNQWDVAKVTTMAASKSIRIVEDDFTWHELMLLWLGGIVGVLELVVMNGFAFFGLSQYFDQGSSAYFSCALTVNEISLLFLRQCFMGLPPSTETSISGTSRK